MNSVEDDDVSNQIRVGLLPERFFSLAPDGRDDRSDIEGLCVWIKVVVQRVVANVRIEADIDVVLFAPKLLQDSPQVSAEISFNFENDTGQFFRRILSFISE
ncbi:MAG: hypothetical protein DMG76_06700 [Acidobacteria bacterium]|nr:MAG: hypothetical protein DMG76_06700 [Acidobacteriota bacterium]